MGKKTAAEVKAPAGKVKGGKWKKVVKALAAEEAVTVVVSGGGTASMDDGVGAGVASAPMGKKNACCRRYSASRQGQEWYRKECGQSTGSRGSSTLILEST